MTKTHLAHRITSTSKKSYGMFDKAAGLPNAAELIHLELGKPCHDTPEHIKAAVIQALHDGDVHYSDLRGNAKLRAALSAKLKSFNHIDASPDDILIVNGLTQASYVAFMATVNEGDEVILLDPYYPQHVGKVELAGGKVVFAPLDEEHDFAINMQAIRARITPKTRGIVLINPNNPTGRVHRRDELEQLAALAIEHDLLIYTDEVYEYITYDQAQHISIASLPGMRERTISMYAFTKAYAMDGWRLGYVVASSALLAGMSKVLASEVTHVNTFIQHGALAAVTGPSEPIQAMIDDDRVKRDMVVSRINRMPGLRCLPPEGTIYAFVDIRGTGLDSQALADRLLMEAGVVVESGAFYGVAGEGYLRLCFGSVGHDALQTALDRLETFFVALSAEQAREPA